MSPARSDEQLGNAVTANRWARILRGQGLDVQVEVTFEDQEADLLVALHAGRSAASIARFASQRTGRPIVVALTGTDLYRDLAVDVRAQQSLELATRIVVLQREALLALRPSLRERAQVIFQSADVGGVEPLAPSGEFQVCMLAHLRPVKAPDVAWRAVRALPADSRVTLVHLGRALSPDLGALAIAEASTNPRYEWRGELPRAEALGILAGSRLHVLTSEIEGASGALTEAIALGVPSLATEIPGNVGVLGADYPGFFPVGDAAALARLLRRAETEPVFLDALRTATLARQSWTTEASEREAWGRLVTELASDAASLAASQGDERSG